MVLSKKGHLYQTYGVLYGAVMYGAVWCNVVRPASTDVSSDVRPVSTDVGIRCFTGGALVASRSSSVYSARVIEHEPWYKSLSDFSRRNNAQQR
jgi:hypothetical protein